MQRSGGFGSDSLAGPPLSFDLARPRCLLNESLMLFFVEKPALSHEMSIASVNVAAQLVEVRIWAGVISDLD